MKKRYIIFADILALLLGTVGALQPNFASAAIGWDDLRNLQVIENATNGNILINKTDGKKFYYLGVARNNTLLDFGLDLALYEREDKALYTIINPETGKVRGYAVTGENAYEYKFDSSNVFGDWGVSGLNLFKAKIDMPKDYYTISGKISGKLDLKDFNKKAQTLNDASISIRVGDANAWLTQADVKEDGTFSLSNSIFNNVGANSIIVDTSKVNDVLVYGYYKDINGQFWEGEKTLNLASDFKRDPNNSQGMVYTKGEINILMTPTAKPTLSQQNIITVSSPFDTALTNAIRTFAGFAETTINWAVNAVRGLLTSTSDYVLGNVDNATQGVRGPWITMRNIGLTLLVMALIIIAFANVLQIDIEQYGLNRMIPKIIISIILAFFSWIIVVFFFDFTKALQDQASGLINGPNGLEAMKNISIQTTSVGDAAAGIGASLLIVAIAIGVLFCMIILLFTLLARVVMLSFLLAVAPLAFILNIVPFTSNLYKQWWTEFWKWMFMGPVAVIIIALGSVIAGSVQGNADNSINTTLTPDSVNGGSMLIGLLILAASLYMAATLPMQWGGKIMGSWGKFGKGIWSKTGGAALKAGGKGAWNATGGKYVTKPIAGAWKSWRGDVNRRADMEVAQKANSLLQTVSRGKYGTDRDVMARKVYDAEVKTAGENIGVASAGQPKLISRYHDPHISDFEKAAIEREMASQGDFEKLHADQRFIDQETGGWVQPTADKNSQPELYKQQKDALDAAQRQARTKAGTALMEKMGSDQVLEKSVKDNQAELVVAARNALKDTNSPAGNYARSQYAAVMAGQKNKSLKDKRMNILDEIAADEVKNFITAEDATQLGDAQSSSNKVRSKVKDFQERMVNEKTNDDVPEYLRAAETTAPVNAGAETTPPSNPGPNSGGFIPGGYHGEGEDD